MTERTDGAGRTPAGKPRRPARGATADPEPEAGPPEQPRKDTAGPKAGAKPEAGTPDPPRKGGAAGPKAGTEAEPATDPKAGPKPDPKPDPKRPADEPAEQAKPKEPNGGRGPDEIDTGEVVKRVKGGPRTPVARLIAAALDPKADKAKAFAALRVAEQRLARDAVRLRRRALLSTGDEVKQYDAQALAALKDAAAIGKLMAEFAPPALPAVDVPARPDDQPEPAPPAATSLQVVAPPAVVTANNLDRSAAVSWTPSPTPAVTAYVVVPIVNGTPQPAVTVPGTTLSTVVTGLTNGTRCRFTVAARTATATSAPSAPSNEVVIGTATTYVPVLPKLSAEPAALVDALADTKRRLVAEAGELGRKWRYEHLKVQAVKAAQDAIVYDEHVARLMAMNLEKVGTAELLLNPVLQDAAKMLTEAAQQIVGLADAAPVDKLVADIASTSAQALLLQRLLGFLAEQSPVKFWVGVFDALIDDVASFDGGIPRTRRYLGEVFDSPDLGPKVQALYADIRATLDQEVERVVAPLRDAVAAVIGGTSEALNEVFGAFDEPLVMQAASGAGLPDVPNGNPLRRVQDRLEQAVQQLTDLVQQRVNEVLDKAGGKDLFVLVAATYLVLPILVFLVIAIAGGPFSAAALAAVVLLAAQELVRLILRWLAGPLQRKLDELVDGLGGRIRELHALFAKEATLVELSSPQPFLEILASELRELKNLLPSAFLDDAAALLDEARAVVLRTATQLALGAEQALGMESGTAFDAIGFTYDTGLTPAPQMPGGNDPNRLAGAAVLRDLGRLEQQRIGLHDGKEMELTQAVPLDDLLPELRRNGQAVIDLTESDLFDSRVPGFYRALVKEVRLTGLLASTTAPRLVTGGVPIVVTHLGESRTRVKRGGNPAAPPIELPDCPGLRSGSRTFARAVLGTMRAEVREAVLRAYRDAREQHRRGSGLFEPIFPPDDVYATWFDVQDVVRRALAVAIPSTVEREIRARGCGYVDPAAPVAAAEALVAGLDLSGVPSCRFFWIGVTCPSEEEVVAATLSALPWHFLWPVPHAKPWPRPLGGTVFEAVERAHARARSDYRDRIAKWGDAYLVEDPDPNVRALGYVTLVRPMPEETAVFNLAAAAGGMVPTGALPVTSSVAKVDVDPLQYRPFENRGAEGKLLVRMPVEAASALTGLTLELVVRGCHDPALASTLQAGRSQQKSATDVVKAYAGTVSIGSVTRRIENAELRTVRLSLRAHRDRTLLMWLAAKQADLANTGTLPAGIPALPDVAALGPLGRDEPLRPLPGVAPDAVVLRFRRAAVTGADSLALGNTLIVTPADLGLPPLPLEPLAQHGVPSLLSVGLAVIPTREGARTIDAAGNLADPLPLAVDVAPALRSLLQPSQPNRTPRFAVSAPDAAPVPLTSLFGAEPVDVRFGFGTGLTGAQVYDVIVSLTYRVPVLSGRAPLGLGAATAGTGGGGIDLPIL